MLTCIFATVVARNSLKSLDVMKHTFCHFLRQSLFSLVTTLIGVHFILIELLNILKTFVENIKCLKEECFAYLYTETNNCKKYCFFRREFPEIVITLLSFLIVC